MELGITLNTTDTIRIRSTLSYNRPFEQRASELVAAPTIYSRVILVKQLSRRAECMHALITPAPSKIMEIVSKMRPLIVRTCAAVRAYNYNDHYGGAREIVSKYVYRSNGLHAKVDAHALIARRSKNNARDRKHSFIALRNMRLPDTRLK